MKRIVIAVLVVWAALATYLLAAALHRLTTIDRILSGVCIS